MITLRAKPLRGFPASFYVIVIGMTAAIVLFAVMATMVTERITQQMAVVAARDLGDMLAAWSRGPLDRREWASLNSLARLHSSNPGLRFVCFVVQDDDLPPSDKPLPSRAIQTVSTLEVRHRLAAGLPAWAIVDVPIFALEEDEPGGPPRLLGEVVVGIEPDRAYMLITKAHIWIAGQSTVLGTLLVILAVMFWRRLHRPMEQLAAQADELVSKNWGCPAGPPNQGDLGKVGNALGLLAGELASREAELEQLQQQIEQRVQERTRLLHELASRDPLTGLHNRRYFSHTLGPAFDQARRYNTPLTLMMIDLDDFKHVNDEHGHAVGDEVLILLATTLTTELRAADIGARFGGDEFVILMPQTNLEEATWVIERVRDVFTESCKRHLNGLTVSLSIGTTTLGPEISTATELLGAADEAMYQAKREGKNRICCHLAKPSGASKMSVYL